MLYLFPFLHQATTQYGWKLHLYSCISSLFYIKPQLHFIICKRFYSCISSLFYIKPQQKRATPPAGGVVSLPFSTSSHNVIWYSVSCVWVVSLPFSTSSHNLICEDKLKAISCISSLFYIKPQRLSFSHCSYRSCISSLFYIKPQHKNEYMPETNGCISSLFYIKPQHVPSSPLSEPVVSLPFSTSSHNAHAAVLFSCPVVSLPFSTSSHNYAYCRLYYFVVVSLPFSTSSHNQERVSSD